MKFRALALHQSEFVVLVDMHAVLDVQSGSRIVRVHFASLMTSNNRKIIADVSSYIAVDILVSWTPSLLELSVFFLRQAFLDSRLHHDRP